MKNLTTGATPKPFPMPQFLMQTFAQTFHLLPSGNVLVTQAGEKTQTISYQSYLNIAAVFNR